MTEENTQRKNRNGRNGNLTSWKYEARDYIKNLYSLYSQFKQKVYLEQTDINFLESCYLGKLNKQDELRRFIVRQFRLMGYPQDNKSKMQKKGYVEILKGLIVLDFGFNEDRIDKALFNDYMKENRLTEQNEAHNSPIIKEKERVNIKPLAERVNKSDIEARHKKRLKDVLEKHKADLDNTYNQEMKGGWINGEDI